MDRVNDLITIDLGSLVEDKNARPREKVCLAAPCLPFDYC